jgi:hypothetical protein
LRVIQEALLTAVQPHPDWVVTPTVVPAPAASRTLWLVGVIVYEQPGSCAHREGVLPAIVIVPVRWIGVQLRRSVQPTFPVTSSRCDGTDSDPGSLLAAVQVQTLECYRNRHLSRSCDSHFGSWLIVR